MTYVVRHEFRDDEGRRQHVASDRYHHYRNSRRSWVKPPDMQLFRRGTKWHSRYQSSNDVKHLDRALRNLGESVWGRAPYVGNVNTSRRNWSRYANNFAVALLDAYRHSQGIRHLDNAIYWLQRALDEINDDTPVRAQILANLITAVEERASLNTKDKVSLPDLTELRRTLSTSVSAPTTVRLTAARSAGYAAAEENAANGFDGLDLAVSLLPQAAWWGNDRATREQMLANNPGLATDAAACAIAAGQPKRALELLEGGRAVLWTQVLKTRNDRTELRRVAPRLAKRMDRVAAALEKDRGIPADKRMALVSHWTKLDGKAEHKLAREWASMAKRAQSAVPDGSFVLPTYDTDLGPAGAEGPVVIVNVSRFGCHAVIVTKSTDDPIIVDLSELTEESATTNAQQYLSALKKKTGAERERVVSDTLSWLWRVIATPVLDAISQDDRTGDDSETSIMSRVWWCPTGPLMVLPLHAAGHHTGDSDAAVLDRVLSSYTPALKTLVHARERRDAEPAAGAGHSRRLLHVTLADTPGQASLPGVSRTKSYFDQLFPAERLTNLDGAKVSRTSVEEQIYRHAWAHFDCHGVQNLTSPFQGGLVLHDQTLVVADLAGIRHDGAEFAFLAACQTAVGGARIPDESITITSAFQYAGYQHVIGTQWSVPDRVTARIIKSVYDVIVTDGELNPAQAAQALHKALCAERSNGRQHPSAWAPFIHVGL